MDDTIDEWIDKWSDGLTDTKIWTLTGLSSATEGRTVLKVKCLFVKKKQKNIIEYAVYYVHPMLNEIYCIFERKIFSTAPCCNLIAT